MGNHATDCQIASLVLVVEQSDAVVHVINASQNVNVRIVVFLDVKLKHWAEGLESNASFIYHVACGYPERTRTL